MYVNVSQIWQIGDFATRPNIFIFGNVRWPSPAKCNRAIILKVGVALGFQMRGFKGQNTMKVPIPYSFNSVQWRHFIHVIKGESWLAYINTASITDLD